jgi:hypothetical protein
VQLDNEAFGGAVHPLDLTICLWMLDLGQLMPDVIFLATHVEHCVMYLAVGVSAWREGELNTIVIECHTWHRLASAQALHQVKGTLLAASGFADDQDFPVKHLAAPKRG